MRRHRRRRASAVCRRAQSARARRLSRPEISADDRQHEHRAARQVDRREECRPAVVELDRRDHRRDHRRRRRLSRQSRTQTPSAAAATVPAPALQPAPEHDVVEPAATLRVRTAAASHSTPDMNVALRPARSRRRAVRDGAATPRPRAQTRGSRAMRASRPRGAAAASSTPSTYSAARIAAVGWCRGDVVGSAHRSRHAFSLSSPRRIQLLIVPIGVRLRAARFS